MKKFLMGFGGFLILLGAVGMINHLSMAYQSAQSEMENYGGSIQFMMLQFMSSLGPYFSSLIGGGIILSFTLFLSEYQKRSELTAQLINVLSEKTISHTQVNTEATFKKNDDKYSPVPTDNTTNNPGIHNHKQDDEPYYWQG